MRHFLISNSFASMWNDVVALSAVRTPPNSPKYRPVPPDRRRRYPVDVWAATLANLKSVANPSRQVRHQIERIEAKFA